MFFLIDHELTFLRSGERHKKKVTVFPVLQTAGTQKMDLLKWHNCLLAHTGTAR